MRSSIMMSCLLSSSVHALLVPATRPGVMTNHPAATRLGTPVMKGSLGRRVLLLAPLAPLLAAPASVLAVPSVEDKRKADREKVAKERLALQKKSQDRARRDVANAKKNPERARKQLAEAKKKDAKDKQKAAKQRIVKQKEDAKIAKIKDAKRRRAQGKKVRKSGGLGFIPTVLLAGGLGLGALVLADDENSADGAPPAVVEDAVAVEETPA
jgi:hypothetical protein